MKITLLCLKDTQNGKELFGLTFNEQEQENIKELCTEEKLILSEEDLTYFYELANDMLGVASYDGAVTKVEYYQGTITLSGSQVKYEGLEEEQVNEFANDLLYPYLESKYA